MGTNETKKFPTTIHLEHLDTTELSGFRLSDEKCSVFTVGTTAKINVFKNIKSCYIRLCNWVTKVLCSTAPKYPQLVSFHLLSTHP